MKKTFTLRKINIWRDFYFTSLGLRLCSSQIYDLWEVPRDVKTITVIVSTQLTKNSYAVSKERGFHGDFGIHYNGKWHWLVLYCEAASIFLKLLAETNQDILYVSVEY